MAYLRKKGKNYFATFYYRGQRIEKACHTNQYAVADKIRKELEAQIANNSFKMETIQQTKALLLTDFTDEYLIYSNTNKAKKSADSDRFSLRNLLEAFGNVPLDSLTPQKMEQFKSEMVKKYSSTSVNIMIRHLKAAFNKALDWKYVDHNPLKKVKLIPIPEEDAPFMSIEDVTKLRATMRNGLYRDFIETSLYTGMRVSEIRNMKWDDIDFVNKKIRVRNTESFSTKSKRSRTIPLHPNLEQILMLRSHVDHSPFVFVTKDTKLVDITTANHAYKRYCKLAQLDERFHFHTLRHTFASHMAMSGVSLYFIQKILGHASIETTARIYAHLQPEPLLSAVKGLPY